MNKERQTCNLCEKVLEDIKKEPVDYRRDFEQMVKNFECQKHYVCLPRLIQKEKNEREKGEL